MNLNILATAIFVTASASAASAQQLAQEVDVTHDIVPTHRSFSRLQQVPVIGLKPVAASPVEYSQRMTSAPVVPTASFYQPSAWNDTLPTSPYRGYAMAAYWPAYHVDASAGYRFIDTDHTRLSAWGQFNGANYKVSGIEHRHSSAAFGVDLHQAVGKRSFIDAGIDYRFSSFNPYYDIPGDLYEIQAHGTSMSTRSMSPQPGTRACRASNTMSMPHTATSATATVSPGMRGPKLLTPIRANRYVRA